MDFDLTLILLGMPIAFVLGWVASRMDVRQLRMENRQAPKAYFKGLNFLLNEQQDQAIDASLRRCKTTLTPLSCTLPWATCFAAVANTSGRYGYTSICCRVATWSPMIATAPNTR
jgi:hypothetical protein